MRKPKIGVFIVAYYAESTISDVLDRIPEDAMEMIDEIFLFDDSSTDRTVEVAQGMSSVFKEKLKIFRNSVNLGYGGNQKRGYNYAIEKGFDYVVLLHGDGQYAPEVIMDLLRPLMEGEADAVFGSRMLAKGAALKGGMPKYKFIGNKILTFMQNLLLGANLSEFHSGYRAYSVKALEGLNFLENSNDFHFDTQIIIQLINMKHRIKEVPIPTYYGDEICRVDGIKYAWNVIMSTLKYKAHNMGMLYDSKYSRNEGVRYEEKKSKYSSHYFLSKLVNSGSERNLTVLDVGCASGALAQKIKQQGHTVHGMDVFEDEEISNKCDQFFLNDVSRGLNLSENDKYDVIVYGDVLEHLKNPEEIISQSWRHLKDGGYIVASTGNVAHFSVRFSLLFGFFNYQERGILDRDHARLFTIGSFKKLFKKSGFKIDKKKYTPIPFELIFRNRIISGLLEYINLGLIFLSRSLFGYQIVVRAKKLVTPNEFLRNKEIEKDYQPVSNAKQDGP